jgi:hypothetical protein
MVKDDPRLSKRLGLLQAAFPMAHQWLPNIRLPVEIRVCYAQHSTSEMSLSSLASDMRRSAR